MYSKSIQLIAVLMSAFVALVLCEAFLRVTGIYTPDSLRTSPYSFSCYRSGTYYWLGFTPGSECILHSNVGAFEDVRYVFNSHGLCGADMQIPKPSGRQRILFLGDSFITGWGVPEKMSMVKRFETLFAEAQPGIEFDVVNAGLSATGPAYSYIFLKTK